MAIIEPPGEKHGNFTPEARDPTAAGPSRPITNQRKHRSTIAPTQEFFAIKAVLNAFSYGMLPSMSLFWPLASCFFNRFTLVVLLSYGFFVSGIC